LPHNAAICDAASGAPDEGAASASAVSATIARRNPQIFNR
jgi:hypothetical protein